MRRVALLAVALASACGQPAAGPGPEEPATAGMVLSSPDFDDGQPIPARHAYTGEGENVQPALEWSGLPGGTVELALVVDDPDAPGPAPWVHCVIYKIPPEPASLSDGSFVEGKNGWDETGWGGPKPPPGKAHRYFFRLYALDAALDLAPGLTKDELLDAMEGHVIGTATLVGTYRR